MNVDPHFTTMTTLVESFADVGSEYKSSDAELTVNDDLALVTCLAPNGLLLWRAHWTIVIPRGSHHFVISLKP